MTHPEDDDDIADHGTVIMDRKAASAIPRPRGNASGSRPAPPAIMPAAGTPAQSPSGLPVLSPSIAGLAAAPPVATSSGGKRLALFVAFGSFTVVFVLGALVMMMVRLARDANDETPGPSAPAQTKPTPATRK